MFSLTPLPVCAPPSHPTPTPSIPGAGYQAAAYYFNLGHFSNAATIWLGMYPSTVFFFIFLPPLLFVDAIHLDYFLFKKVGWVWPG
jgi:hypothetical protein